MPAEAIGMDAVASTETMTFISVSRNAKWKATPMDQKPVKVYPNHQYVTGGEPKPGSFLAEKIYAETLDVLVVCCSDAAILYQGQWLIARRAWEPYPDWWVIGGRMRKGERIEQALQRNLQRELHLYIPEDRLLMIIGYSSQIWDTRAWEPVTNGYHMFSLVSAVHLTDDEKARLQLNEEYAAFQWIDPGQVVAQESHFHPCLVQFARDLLRSPLLSSGDLAQKEILQRD